METRTPLSARSHHLQVVTGKFPLFFSFFLPPLFHSEEDYLNQVSAILFSGEETILSPPFFCFPLPEKNVTSVLPPLTPLATLRTNLCRFRVPLYEKEGILPSPSPDSYMNHPFPSLFRINIRWFKPFPFLREVLEIISVPLFTPNETMFIINCLSLSSFPSPKIYL